jgi:fructosamine-3-kinase
MHRFFSDKGFGFEVDNTIGATPQPNLPWMDNWPDFWDTHRLGQMLKLTGNSGLSQSQGEELRAKTRQLLSIVFDFAISHQVNSS